MKKLKFGAGILLALLTVVCIFVYSRQLVYRFGIGNHIEFRNWKASPVEFADVHDGDMAPFTLPLNDATAGRRKLTVTLTKDISVMTFKQTDGTLIGTAKRDYANHRVLATVSNGQSTSTSLKMMSGILKKPVSHVNRFTDFQREITVLNEMDKRASYAKYKEAVVKASKNMTYPDGQKYYITKRPESEQPAFFKELIDHFVDNGNGDGDPYYSSYTHITGTATFNPSKQIWTADKYDSGKFMEKISLIEYWGDGIPRVELTWEENP